MSSRQPRFTPLKARLELHNTKITITYLVFYSYLFKIPKITNLFCVLYSHALGGDVEWPPESPDISPCDYSNIFLISTDYRQENTKHGRLVK